MMFSFSVNLLTLLIYSYFISINEKVKSLFEIFKLYYRLNRFLKIFISEWQSNARAIINIRIAISTIEIEATGIRSIRVIASTIRERITRVSEVRVFTTLNLYIV